MFPLEETTSNLPSLFKSPKTKSVLPVIPVEIAAANETVFPGSEDIFLCTLTLPPLGATTKSFNPSPSTSTIRTNMQDATLMVCPVAKEIFPDPVEVLINTVIEVELFVTTISNLPSLFTSPIATSLGPEMVDAKIGVAIKLADERAPGLALLR